MALDATRLSLDVSLAFSVTGSTGGHGRVRQVSVCLLISLAIGTGNCFYVSMPAEPLDSSTEHPRTPPSPSQCHSLPAWPTEPPQHRGVTGGQRSSLVLRDVGVIFHTIEQLTVKLHRLKVRGVALGRKPSIQYPGQFPERESDRCLR